MHIFFVNSAGEMEWVATSKKKIWVWRQQIEIVVSYPLPMCVYSKRGKKICETMWKAAKQHQMKNENVSCKMR